MAKHTFGLQSVKLGEVEEDGGMSTALVEVGETVTGSATMTTEDNQVTDFNIEESDSPVESVVTTPGKITFAWSTFNTAAEIMVRFFGGTVVDAIVGVVNRIATLGSITGGSSYTPGTYSAVPLTGGTGTGATANITVSGGGAVTVVTLVSKGSGYSVADTLSALAANIGGTGSGFSVPVATRETITAVGEKWQAPDSFQDVERSVELLDKKGNVVQIPRAKISAKMGLSFAKDKLGQLDMVATVLQPEKSGEKRITIIYA